MAERATRRREAAAMIAPVWLGLVLGVSFYAAPIKFHAVSVAREDLLVVGRVTFQNFTIIEVVAFALLLVTTWGLARPILVAMGVLGLLLAVQKLVLLPGLDAALVETVAGQARSEPWLHLAYIGTEVAKLVVLFGLTFLLRDPKAAVGAEDGR